MNANGSGPIRLTIGVTGSFEPCWSPDGAKIAFDEAKSNLGDERKWL